MSQRDVEIATPDGTCPASLHVPKRYGCWPAVLMYPDAGGLRPLFQSMGEQLARVGYVVLIPDVYYRQGHWEPFDLPNAFCDPKERLRLLGLTSSMTREVAVRDAKAFGQYLLALPEVKGNCIRTTGYGAGGRMSMIAAGHLGKTIAAAASFYGGGLVSDSLESPHLRAAHIRATVYVAGASRDSEFTDQHRTTLEQALTDAGVAHHIETYPALHGFAVKDSGRYEVAAAKRHWDAMAKLFSEAPPRSAGPRMGEFKFYPASRDDSEWSGLR